MVRKSKGWTSLKKSVGKTYKPDVTDFVKRMRELSFRIKPKLLWYSKEPDKKGTTYIKAKHGELR